MKLRNILIGRRFYVTADQLGHDHMSQVLCIKLFGDQVQVLSSGKVVSVDQDAEVFKA